MSAPFDQLSWLPIDLGVGISVWPALHTLRLRGVLLNAVSLTLLPSLIELEIYLGESEHLPVELMGLVGLRSLSLTGHRIRSIRGDFFYGFFSMRQLNLRVNRLSALPVSLGFLNLKEFSFTGARVENFVVVGRLAHLESLHLPITSGRTRNFEDAWCLPSLKKLEVCCDNGVSSFPPVLYAPNLVSLSISIRCLNELSDSVGSLVKLETLSICASGLRALPRSLVQLRHLRCLNLWGCDPQLVEDWVLALPSLSSSCKETLRSWRASVLALSARRVVNWGTVSGARVWGQPCVGTCTGCLLFCRKYCDFFVSFY